MEGFQRLPGRSVALEGELVTQDADGRPKFPKLHLG